jgi:hypothetical protein
MQAPGSGRPWPRGPRRGCPGLQRERQRPTAASGAQRVGHDTRCRGLPGNSPHRRGMAVAATVSRQDARSRGCGSPRPAVIGTILSRAALRRPVHRAAASACKCQQRWRGQGGPWTGSSRLLTGVTERLMEEFSAGCGCLRGLPGGGHGEFVVDRSRSHPPYRSMLSHSSPSPRR